MAQQSEDAILYRQGTRYVDGHIHALDKYNVRIQKQQQKLLTKLSRQENRFAAQLARNDSAGYASYKRQQLGFDSISRMLHPDSSTLAGRFARKKNKSVDSLIAINSFVQNRTTGLPGSEKTGSTVQLDAYGTPLKQLGNQLNYNDYINNLITQRSAQLKAISLKNNLAAFSGIDKQIGYAKAKMQVWKQVAEEPTAAEEKALEYLQGTAGFDGALSKGTTGKGITMNNANSADDLESMGFQTKRQVNTMLKAQLGSNMGAVQQKIGDQVTDWQQKNAGIEQKIKALKTDIASARQAKTTIKQQVKAAARGNAMRGVPFWKRFEKQYSFQTSRAGVDGTPAMLQLSAAAGYKQTERLVTGAGLAGNIGLGQSWSRIRFSLEGIGVRTFATYEMIFGVSLYAGYERMFKQVSFNTNTAVELGNPSSPHNTANYSEAVLLGLSKSYKITGKNSGAIQVLYDVWWKEKGMRSPIILRINYK